MSHIDAFLYGVIHVWIYDIIDLLFCIFIYLL